MSRPTHFPGPDRPEARYDAVVSRGRTLRRHDQIRKVAVTGGAAVVLVLVLALSALAVGRGDTNRDQSPATDPTPDSSIATTTTVLDRLTISTERSGDDIRVLTDQPAILDGARTCVRINLRPEGPAATSVSETTLCWSPADGPATTATVMQRTEADVGCGAVVERDPDAPGEADGQSTATQTPAVPPAGSTTSHEFRFTLPEGLDAGSYVAEVETVTGTGDACPTAWPEDTDVVATDKITVTVG